MAITTPPAGLAGRGGRFWTRILASYELDIDELELLLEVCRTLDVLDQLAEVTAAAGTTATGSTGQPVVHPAIAEARGQRQTLDRLLKALNLPSEDTMAGTNPTSRKAAKAAASRWRTHKKGA